MATNHGSGTHALVMQDVILRMQRFWSERGCAVLQPINTEVGAGTANPATALRVLGPEPWRAAYVEPSVRPDDSRYGDNPNRLQTHTQFQVILKPDPGNPQELYLSSLESIGIDLHSHDVRFVEDNWASPALGAWGLGWEVWLDGLEITQFTYFQQVGGLNLDPPSVEITYGLERILMALQGVTHHKKIRYADDLSYEEVFGQSEYEMSRYYLDEADLVLHRSLFERYAGEAQRLIELELPVPAYSYVLKCSHTFNVLDARGAVSTTDRAKAFTQMRGLSRDVARLWVHTRERLGHPLGVWSPPPPAAMREVPAVVGVSTLLFEIGTEELPAAEVPRGAKAVEAAVREKLASSRLVHGEVVVHSTPRRVVLTVADVDDHEQEKRKLIRGPRLSAARDADGNSTKALAGFLQGQGATEAEMSVHVQNGVEYVVLDRLDVGRPAAEVLTPLLSEVASELRSGKNIRWGDPQLSYSRPLRWLLALLGDTPLPVQASLLRSGTTTRVMRTAASPVVEVAQADGFVQLLADNGIVLRRNARRDGVLEAAARLAASVGGVVDVEAEAALIDEITDLVESPVGVLGSFDERYLELPASVLTTVMRKHQRYLPVPVDGSLSPYFVVIANGECNADIVRAGNETVLRARFEDASFFWHDDLKVTPEEFRQRLDRLQFEERLGSFAQRAERIETLATEFADWSGLDTRDRATIARAGQIAKFDLASQMVAELSSLAGVMAREYALQAGEPSEVADALAEMEMPRASGEPVPSSRAGAVLSLADRLDFLAAMLTIGATPTGSSDPFGIRRAASGVVRVLRAFPDLEEISVRRGIQAAGRLLSSQGVAVPADLAERAADFVARRYEKQLLEDRYEPRVVRAVLPWAGRPAHADRLLTTLETRAGDDWTALVVALQRVLRILPEDLPANADLSALRLPVELELAGSVALLRDTMSEKRGDLGAFVSASHGLAGKIDAFFDAVLVMDPDSTVRAARLGLLATLAAEAMSVLDWSAL